MGIGDACTSPTVIQAIYEAVSRMGFETGNILEPKMSCALVTAADIDFAVVPCLSFDRKGRRLGQGGGYYDRLLPQLRCPTALICREQLTSPEVPVEEHDMRCTMLITEKGILTPEA